MVSSVIYRARCTAHSSFCSSKIAPTRRGQCLFAHLARLKEGRKVAALTQFRDAKLDGSGPGLPVAVPVAVTMIQPIRCPGTGLSPGQGLNLQRHQPLSGEADHLTQKVGIAGLFQQGLEVHGLGGHRWGLGLGSVVVTKPYRRSAMPPPWISAPTPLPGTQPTHPGDNSRSNH